MVARIRLLQARLLPHGWTDVVRQVCLFGLAYIGYRIARGLAEGNANAAFAHARELISLERTLHLFVEPSVQTWASSSHFLMTTASWLYVNAQGPVTIGALLCYSVFPTAPPRFMPEWGFVDTVGNFTPVNVSHGSATMSALFNPYAAVPSMHVAFALMIGWPLARLVRSPIAAVLWILYPFLMTFVIVVTANHFIVDALLGAITAGVSAYVAVWLARARPAAWRFSTVPAASVTASG